MPRRVCSLLALAAALLVVAAIGGSATASGSQGTDFVKRSGPDLRLHGKLFRFAGTNNYYLMYKSRFMVDDVLERAADAGFTVVRTWGFLDIGNQDGSNSIRGKSDGVYFHYWDQAAGAPAFNDGPDGLQHLDYVIARAGELGLKLVIPLVNNWDDFGGMDQYVRWRATVAGGTWYHDSFYTDPVIRGWYRDWISHLLNRTNTITGVKYKDDPTIMTWELGNEPRCTSAGAYSVSPTCSTTTLIGWADEMSRYIKSIDNKHLVSVGDEGFYCIDRTDPDWTRACGEGVDTVAFTRLPAIDVMSFHSYPDYWGKDVAWGVDWIRSHFAAARSLDKPAMLGEFGLKDKSMRNPNYKLWLDTVLRSGGAGALYWILSAHQDDGSLYGDFDGFTVYCPSPVCTTIANFSNEMAANRELVFPPVADDDAAVTEFQTPVGLDPPANDIAYGGGAVVRGTLDLDPSTAGVQTTRTVVGGTFVAAPDGTVEFTPAEGFSGSAATQYVIEDSAGRTSNAATLSVTVKPNPTGTLMLASYEDGLDGAGAESWGGTGSVAQSTDWASDGSAARSICTRWAPRPTESWRSSSAMARGARAPARTGTRRRTAPTRSASTSRG
jgi:mannan endo-1,4-beta-mannosidase